MYGNQSSFERQQNPVPSELWTGDYDATWERSRCIQKNDLRPQAVVEGSEDCLYLNVFRPKVDIRIIAKTIRL